MFKRFFKKYYYYLIPIGLVASLLLDREVAIEFTEGEYAFFIAIAHYITDVALGVYWVIISIFLIIIASLFMKHSKPERFLWFQNIRNFAFHLFFAILSTGFLVMIIKYIVGRERPQILNEQSHIFSTDPLNFDDLYHSFPSGHTQVIFCVGTMLGYLWPKQRYFFLIVAAIIAFTRVMTLKHFMSDVYVGMLLGTLGCIYSVSFWSKWIQQPIPIEEVQNGS